MTYELEPSGERVIEDAYRNSLGGYVIYLYRRAVVDAGRLWDRLRTRVEVPLIGTADHGHLDYDEPAKLLLRDPEMGDLTWFGDSRSLMVRGDVSQAERLLAPTGADLYRPDVFVPWFGDDPDPHPDLAERLPHLVALAPDDHLLLPRGFDRRLVGYHGGLRREEVEIPLLIG